jgi:hypothetical protein
MKAWHGCRSSRSERFCVVGEFFGCGSAVALIAATMEALRKWDPLNQASPNLASLGSRTLITVFMISCNGICEVRE